MARKKSIGKYIIIISAIVLLNLIGVGYGYWTEGLQMKASVSTGTLDIDVYKTSIANNEIEGLVAYPEGDRIRVEGEIPDNFKGTEVILSYSVRNIGTVPVLVEDSTIDGRTIEPGGPAENFQVYISLSEDFEYKLPITQATQ
ncbi:hypothetical protein SAMN05660297_00789 [Natronincola peptidivorans]|uniref:SipW-cognate class signal peptide n=1 Tax=Natronincola peptidivorans TaxID=426128 RepID=A0A1I0A021_9FIRM|nr:hypothetical protein [Natronincola peptidivorans]SES86991.1 hypothetical protein SAMN05660297_00789 [Natronincola peptidivorans]